MQGGTGVGWDDGLPGISYDGSKENLTLKTLLVVLFLVVKAHCRALRQHRWVAVAGVFESCCDRFYMFRCCKRLDVSMQQHVYLVFFSTRVYTILPSMYPVMIGRIYTSCCVVFSVVHH